MQLPKPWHYPLRLVSGAFILNSGLAKRPVQPEAAAHLHGFATTAHPEFKNMDPERFVNLLSLSEIALGSALITPIVPSWVAGTELALFSAGLLCLYLRAPGLRREGSLRPNEQGIPLAKDVWIFGMALALLIDAVSDAVEARTASLGAARSGYGDRGRVAGQNMPIKRDALPGKINHDRMNFHVHVVSDAKFQSWLAEQRRQQGA